MIDVRILLFCHLQTEVGHWQAKVVISEHNHNSKHIFNLTPD